MNRKLRPQGAPRADRSAPTGTPSKKKALIAGAGATLLVAGIGLSFALGNENEPSAAAIAPEPAGSVAAATAAQPAAAAKDPAKKGAKGAPKSSNGIVADVPLFGPTPMATLEPAPLDPPPDDADEPAEAEEARAAMAETPDESFDEPPAASRVVPAVVEPEKPVEPWSVGRLHLPFVHRLKLDAPGVALEGTKKSTGFSVFLPKRKVLESGKAIERRDDRIIEVRTSNEPGGARVTFVFQGKVPPYKVRLKKNYVEFFISSAHKS